MNNYSNRTSEGIWMFLIGLFSMTQIYLLGFIGISEVCVFILAPILYIQDRIALRNDGFNKIIFFSLASVVGCLLASFWNDTPWQFIVKGVASPYSMFAFTVIFHHFLRRDFRSFKWFVLGLFLSGIISIYLMQGAAAYNRSFGTVITGEEAKEVVVSGPLFWSVRIAPSLLLPVEMFYLQCPFLYGVIAPIVVAIIALMASEGSGRSIALAAFMGSVLLFIGRKRQAKMFFFKRHFFMFLIVVIIGLNIFKIIYSAMADRGILGEQARMKYAAQTGRGKGAISMLISGRVDFFVGLYACCKNPIIGYGPWPPDKYGYREMFLSRWGTAEDLENANDVNVAAIWRMKAIPAHSHIIGFWLEYGVFGLLLWVYILRVLYRFIRYQAGTLPQLYGFLAISIPTFVWNIFFSPYGSRAFSAFIVTLVLIVDAFKRCKISISTDAYREIMRMGK